MATKRDYVTEIQARKARGSWYPTNAPFRLIHIRQALTTVPDGQTELLRYFPLALVASVEAFFREATRALVDAGEPFLGNLVRSPMAKDLKCDLGIIAAIAGKQVTAGELVAHLVPIKSVGHIDHLMTSILGSPFLDAIRTVHDRAAVELERKTPAPILTEPDRVITELRATFEYRHIYAHELADEHPLARPQAGSFVDSVSQFLDASAEVIANTLHPNAPLTQGAMNAASWDSYRARDRELTSVYEELLGALDESRASLLQSAQDAWLTFREKHGAFEGSYASGGSMEPLLANVGLEGTTELRIAELRAAQRLVSFDG